MRSTTLLLLSLLISTDVLSQSRTHEAILLPISLCARVSGAFGSLWATEFTVTAVNGDVRFRQPRLSTPLVVPAGRTFRYAGGSMPAYGWPPGEIWYLDRATAPNAVMNLRIRDVSREGSTWGTELPVVRESSFRRGTLHLTNVPLDERFRVALRIYDPDLTRATKFRLRIADASSGTLLVEDVLEAKKGWDFGAGYIFLASAVDIGSLTAAYPKIAGADRVLISVEPAASDVPFWAFVSVTNNETQHVTTITPQ